MLYRLPVLFAALLGCSAVAMNAIADHYWLPRMLAAGLTHEAESLNTALRYHHLYALWIGVLGLFVMLPWQVAQGSSDANPIQSRVVYIAYLFIAGLVLFVLPIYLNRLAGFSALSWLSPWGGTLLILAWLGLGTISFIKLIARKRL